MNENGYEVDVTRNIMKIDLFKNELLQGVTNIFKVMAEGSAGDLNEIVTENLSHLILTCYMLGNRTGIPYAEIDKQIVKTIQNPETLQKGNPLLAEDLPVFMEYLRKK